MADETKAQRIRRRFAQMKTVREDYEPLRNDIVDLVCSRRQNPERVSTPGKKTGLSIYDGTPRSACQQHADGLFGYLYSSTMEWFRLKIARPGVARIPEVKKYLQDSAEQLYYAFNRSNFYSVIPQYFFDGCSIGTATIYAEEDVGQGRIVFLVNNPWEIYIAANRYGEIDIIFRKYKMTARNAVKKFKNLSDRIKQAAKNSPETTFDFLHAVYPNDDRQLGRADSTNKAFSSVYVELEGKNVILSESGYDTFPYSTWRYRVDSGEVYGRSPAADAIVEIFGLNQISKTILGASQKAVEPIYNIPKEMRGKVRLDPGGLNYYEDPERIIRPVSTATSLPAGEVQQKRLEDAIEKHFHTEFFMLLSRAAMEGRTLTVPQVMEMQGEKGAILGAVVGRLNGDFSDPIIDRIFQIENDAGRMPPVPEILYESGESKIDVEYLGPLAQAQRQLLKTQSISRSLATLEPLAQIRPEVMDRINFDVVTDRILDSYNFPAEAIISVDDANMVREQRQKKQEMMEMAAMAQEAAKVAPGLGKKVEENSILSKVEGK